MQNRTNSWEMGSEASQKTAEDDLYYELENEPLVSRTKTYKASKDKKGGTGRQGNIALH
jgi:hypothetical protein